MHELLFSHLVKEKYMMSFIFAEFAFLPIVKTT